MGPPGDVERWPELPYLTDSLFVSPKILETLTTDSTDHRLDYRGRCQSWPALTTRLFKNGARAGR
jgi:hypothetical protein